MRFIFHPITRRWIDLAALTFVGVLVCLIVHGPLSPLPRKFISYQENWPLLIQFSIVALITGFLWLILIRLGGFHISHLRITKLLRYPPVWFAGIIGTFVYILITQDKIQPAGKIDLEEFVLLFVWKSPIIAGIIIATLLDALFHWRSKAEFNGKRFPMMHQSFRTIIDNPNQLFLWIEDESPIYYPYQDLFGLATIARRVSYILLNQHTGTVGVVGTYGSGKTSLLNLVEYYLKNRLELRMAGSKESGVQGRDYFKGEIVLCRIDGWGRVEGSVAEQILSIAVNRLQEKVDCLSVVTMPASYRKALQGVKTTWSTIASALLHTSCDPIEQLERLDNILRATGSRLVIFLEDLDRNTAETIICDELPSLLDRLRSLRNVSFVLAIGTGHQYSNILIRICEHVEAIA